MSHKHTATVATKKKTCTQRFTEEARVFCPNKEILSARPVCHRSTRRLFRQKKNQARVKRVAEVHVVSSFFFPFGTERVPEAHVICSNNNKKKNSSCIWLGAKAHVQQKNQVHSTPQKYEPSVAKHLISSFFCFGSRR